MIHAGKFQILFEQLKAKPVFWLILLLLASQHTWDHSQYVVDFLDTSSKRTFLAFAIARGINAAISVIQSAEIGFSIAVSATFAPGEILDPINDLIERFSLIMLLISSTLWVLRFLSELILSPVLLWSALTLCLFGHWMEQAGTDLLLPIFFGLSGLLTKLQSPI